MRGPSSKRLPTPRTLHKKIRGALEALNAGRVRKVSEGHIIQDMDRLDIDDLSEYWALVKICAEAAAQNPVSCYCGGYPTKRSSKHTIILNKEMWAFLVTVPAHKEKIYFKFALVEDNKSKELYYYHVDCHPSTI